MSNDKANAAYHGAPGDDQVGKGGFRDVGDQGWGDPRNMGEHPPLTAEEALARRSASGSRYDQPTGQEATPGDWYTALGVFLGGGLVGFLVGVLVF